MIDLLSTMVLKSDVVPAVLILLKFTLSPFSLALVFSLRC